MKRYIICLTMTGLFYTYSGIIGLRQDAYQFISKEAAEEIASELGTGGVCVMEIN